MGAIVTADNGEVNGKVNAGETAGNRSGSESTSPTRSDRGGTGAGATATAGGSSERSTAGGSSEAGKQVKETDELAILSEDEKRAYEVADDKEKKRLLTNAKKRKRYAEQKANGGQTVKPRKVNKRTATPQNDVLNETAIFGIIATISSIVGSRPNCSHWILSEAEIKSLSDPLSKMIAESENLANLGQYSNQIALVTACVTIFVPRMIVSIQNAKEDKARGKTGQLTNTAVGNKLDGGGKGGNTSAPTKRDQKSDRNNVGQSSGDGKKHADDVSFYGLPLC